MEDRNERLLAPRALQTTRDNPWPLALLLEKMDEYIDRMAPTWVEAQVIEYNQRPGNRMSFFRAKDLEADMSMQVKAFGNVIAAAGPAMQAGARVVMQVKPDFYTKTGDLSLMAAEIHPAGMGGMLEELERLKQRLAAEGLFSREHKKELPFLPRRVGLICGHKARAQADVKENVWRRWPLMEFEVREVAVQGENCPREVAAAIAELDTVADIDVIVVTRGGGAFEDLLGFSDEGVVRVAFAAQTPIVSAVGHEEDTPLLDFVADFRASTPTDAAKRIVPDCVAESELMERGRQKMRQAVGTRVSAGLEWLQAMRSRPVMQNPGAALEQRRGDIAHGVEIMRARIAEILAVFRQDLAADRATLTAISPRATLERGYAVLRTPGRALITDATTVKKGDLLEAVLARGSLVASVVGANPGAGTAQ
ncbi:exodeoxyribonuclease VII large subunit [Mobiluncus mulieris]|uniref:exodeoxyribonuclease VII large subunit n=1 Tax=Mobiluncus mulieris TaxID=2052 RepID=UPI00146FDF06|nr:exodeoxyribonuclease VII large subunit [Mobiluncus mulieris]NMW60393.1 exodeoxyribonuclease VII large subunit [Mobiluncus mulieris]